jgi:hypothetical protein
MLNPELRSTRDRFTALTGWALTSDRLASQRQPVASDDAVADAESEPAREPALAAGARLAS